MSRNAPVPKRMVVYVSFASHTVSEEFPRWKYCIPERSLAVILNVSLCTGPVSISSTRVITGKIVSTTFTVLLTCVAVFP